MAVTRGKYSETTLRKAVHSMKEDGFSYGKTARMFDILKPTI